MEDKQEFHIDDFIKAVNEKIGEDPNFKEDLNTAVTGALPKDNTFFKSLNEFANFLPKTLKNYFTKEKIKEILGKDGENFEIQDQDLEELYKINLEDKTKLAIIKKFNLGPIKENQLSVTDDINKAISTFKKILGEVKVSVSNFYRFINDNIQNSVLSNDGLNDILGFVKPDNEKDKFLGAMFWNMCCKFKEQLSKEFINFMVQNTDFTNLNAEKLMFTIIILMRRHSEYLKGRTKKSMLKALDDILSGQEPYQEFSKALLNVPDIADSIKLENIIKHSTDTDVLNFVADLIYNGIEIKLDGESENKKFVVDGKKVYSNDELVKFLSQEPGLNEWLKGIFSVKQSAFDLVYKDNKNDENRKKAKENLIIANKDNMDAKLQEVKTLDELIQKMSKVNAIKSFIEKSKDSKRLEKIYRNLSDEVLNKLVLPEDTVKRCLNGLSCVIPGDGLMFNEGQMSNIKSLLEYWGGASKEKEKFLQKLLLAWKCDKKNKNTCSAISYMFSNHMLPTGKGFMSGYHLYNCLSDTPDGEVSISFIKHIGSEGSVDFADLMCDSDNYFGRCLFMTIHALIRTSVNYNSNDPEEQKKAINDVLVNGENYQWFRDGLKTFFKEAKDANNRTAKNINMEDILKEIPDLAKLLRNCKLELKFDYDQDQPENSKLTVEEEKIIEIKKIQVEENNIEDKEITKEALSDLANDKNLPNFIAQYDYTTVTTLKGLKQNVLRAFIKSNQERTKKYELLKNEDLESFKLPSNVIDDLLFRLPSHKIEIEIEDNSDEIITNSKNNNKKALNEELGELKKLYGEQVVSSAGALYFMAACSQESLTIDQQNSILNLCKYEKNEEENENENDEDNIINENDDKDDNKSKSLAKSTFSKALAALESIKDGEPITFELIDFICDNVDFKALNSDDTKEIDNFYGIVYHLIAHNIIISNFISEQTQLQTYVYREFRGLCVSSINDIFSKGKGDEAPYHKFWEAISQNKKDFLALLSSETIQVNSKNKENVYAKKLNDLLNTLKVRIKMEESKISVESVQEPVKEKVHEEQNSNYKEQNSNTDEYGEAFIKVKVRIKAEEDKRPVESVHEQVKEEVHKEKNSNTNEVDNAFPQDDNNGNTKKSKFPKWASVLIKVLIALAILAVAVLALLFGSGVLGTVFGIAAAGTAKTVAWVIAVIAIFAELIYLAVLSSMSKSNDGPGGGGGGGGSKIGGNFEVNQDKNNIIPQETSNEEIKPISNNNDIITNNKYSKGNH